MIWQSWWFFSFFLLLVLSALIHFLKRKKRNANIPLSTFFIVKEISPGLRVRLRLLPDFLKYLSLILVVVALARPQKANEKVKRSTEGIDIMLAVDISHSMLIEDMKPKNRLESAKKTIEEFISKRTSDRIGLVVFSGESYTRVPLTLDYAVSQAKLKGGGDIGEYQIGYGYWGGSGKCRFQVERILCQVPHCDFTHRWRKQYGFNRSPNGS